MKRECEALGLSVVFDARDELRPGAKHFEWEQKGVPARIEVGPRDLDGGTCVVKRRDQDAKQKTSVPLVGIGVYIQALMGEIQKSLYQRAKAFRDSRILEVDTYEDFKAKLETGGKGNSCSPTGMARARPRSASKTRPRRPSAASRSMATKRRQMRAHRCPVSPQGRLRAVVLIAVAVALARAEKRYITGRAGQLA